jgi:hypothetical protein
MKTEVGRRGCGKVLACREDEGAEVWWVRRAEAAPARSLCLEFNTVYSLPVSRDFSGVFTTHVR